LYFLAISMEVAFGLPFNSVSMIEINSSLVMFFPPV
jgi:hypothetical protein